MNTALNHRYIEKIKVNSIRIDFTPREYKRDLCFASGRRALGIDKHGVFKQANYTIKYTSSLCFQAWIKPPFECRRVFRTVHQLRHTLNKFKKTPVRRFKNVRLVNLHASGRCRISLQNSQIWKNITLGNEISLQFELGVDYSEPAIPIDHLDTLAGEQFRFINCVLKVKVMF